MNDAEFNQEKPPVREAVAPKQLKKPLEELIPVNQNSPFNRHDLINGIIDEGSFFEIKNFLLANLLQDFPGLKGNLSVSLPISRVLRLPTTLLVRKLSY